MLASIIRSRPLRLFAAIGATLIGVAVGSNGWAADAGRKHEVWAWSGTLAAGRRLQVNGISGDIIAEPSPGDRVEVTADKSAKHSDPAEVKLEVVQDSDGITICAVYPGQGSACKGKSSGGSWGRNHSDVQVEFHVKVPAGVTFDANTVNGDVTTRSLGGPVRAHTVNGSCDIETARGGEAATVNGNVRATLGKVGADEHLDFSSVNGNITLRLPALFDADLAGSTVNGSIETDFPVTVQGKWGPRSMHGTIGRGGAKLNASTVNGSIKLTQHSD